MDVKRQAPAMVARDYGIDVRDERILRELRRGDRTWKQLTAATGFTSLTLDRHLKFLIRAHLIAKVESTHHRGVKVYSILEPFPGFIRTLEDLESRVAQAGTPEETLEALEVGLFATVRCLVEAYPTLDAQGHGRGQSRKAKTAEDTMMTWSAFLWGSILPGLLAKVKMGVRPEDVFRILERKFPEVAAVWKGEKAPPASRVG